MPIQIATPRLRLLPVTPADTSEIAAFLARLGSACVAFGEVESTEVVARAIVADHRDPGTVSRYWRIMTTDGAPIGLAGLRPPQVAIGRLRAIGWRSLELQIALDPGARGSGYATEAVEVVVGDALADGVTFALLTAIDADNVRAHRLMRHCRFHELGRIADRPNPLVVYERAS